MSSTTPVTVLSGSLGAGKTTLLNGLLDEAGDRDIAVLVNDVGQVNVDADLVSRGGGVDEGRVAELSNGCICCELRGDLETAVVSLARERDFSHLVVEPSGISEPRPVADLFERGSSAAALYRVDAVVTVVDARQFYDALAGGAPEERLAAGDAADADDPRPLSDLLAEQVEFADVVVLNKTDLVDEAELRTVRETAAALRPEADVLETTFSAVDPDAVLDRGLFAQRAEQTGAHGHEGDHAHDGAHAHPEEEYGVDSFVYRRRRPFHPERFAAFAADLPASVIRSKGTVWVAGRDDVRLDYGQAGPSVRVEATGRWIASLPEADQDLYRANRSNVDWDDEVGDRQTELVVIGQEMDEERVVDALDGCLVDPDATVDGENPFPAEPGETTTL
ncbi:MAG: GTP-binding protein [Haloferacaceae archaeon]